MSVYIFTTSAYKLQSQKNRSQQIEIHLEKLLVPNNQTIQNQHVELYQIFKFF